MNQLIKMRKTTLLPMPWDDCKIVSWNDPSSVALLIVEVFSSVQYIISFL